MAKDASRFFAELLAPLGFKRYKDYLHSELWKSIRERVYETKGRECLKCGGPAKQIHHEKYDLPTMRGETLLYLIPICGDCHKIEHGLVQGPVRRKQPAEWKAERAEKKRRRKEKRKTRTPGIVGKIERMLANGTKKFQAEDLPMNLSTVVNMALKEGREWLPIVEAAIQPRLAEKCPCGRLLNLKDLKASLDKCVVCREGRLRQARKLNPSLKKPIHVPKVQAEKTPSHPLRRFMTPTLL